MAEANFGRLWHYQFLDSADAVITEDDLDGDEQAHALADDMIAHDTPVACIRRWVPGEEAWRELPRPVPGA